MKKEYWFLIAFLIGLIALFVIIYIRGDGISFEGWRFQK